MPQLLTTIKYCCFFNFIFICNKKRANMTFALFIIFGEYTYTFKERIKRFLQQFQ